MTQQSTVKEREREINKMVGDFEVAHLVMKTTNQILEPLNLKPKQRQEENDRVDSILKGLFQLAEQKAREEGFKQGFLDGQVYQNNLRRINS